MSNHLWNPADTQHCDSCAVYHYRDDCDDAYFNAPENWAVVKPSRNSYAGTSASASYRKRWA